MSASTAPQSAATSASASSFKITEIPSSDFLSQREVAAVLDNLSRSTIAVLGDFCLDVYWTIQTAAGEVSLETGILTQPVQTQRYSPGGAGNVVMNLLALEVSKIRVFGAIGDDPFGKELTRLLTHPLVDLTGLVTQVSGLDTPTYIKPHLDGKESNRLDFGNFNALSDATATAILDRFEAALPQVSVALINHQIAGSLHNHAGFRARLNALIEAHPEVCFIVDSRGYHEAYPSAVHKLNEGEVLRQRGIDIDGAGEVSLDELVAHAEALHAQWQAPLIMTRGEHGCLVIDDGSPKQIFGVQLLGKVDPVGAGDTFVSALSAIVASGSNLAAAAFVANLAAAVTAQKLYQTGTASPAEILEMAERGDYVYRPELAASPYAARFLIVPEALPEGRRQSCLREEGGLREEQTTGRQDCLPPSVEAASPSDEARTCCKSGITTGSITTEIEVIEEPPVGLQIRHAIFDHDGTISTLRQGWEEIMEPMMLRAIFGGDYKQADPGALQRVTRRVKQFIDKTTGIQTIAQMQGLIELVREFGHVPAAKILDAPGYKHIFNVELKALVNQRLNKLASGQLDIDDFTLKGAVPFLHTLAARGIKLYLASGTDDADVKEEAARLGYAALFTGGIYGSVGDVKADAKKVVIERILSEVTAAGGDCRQLIAFGDGPVEMRETVKRGGYAVGIASDELRRFGMNLEKRARLVSAGAKAIVPDFSQRGVLGEFLGLPTKQ